MATDEERLLVTLEARINTFERQMQRANRTATQNFVAIEKRASQMSTRVNTAMASGGKMLGTLVTGAAISTFLRASQQFLDTATRIQNALKVTGLSGADLSKVYDALFSSAQRNLAPMEALTTLYGRAAQQQKELGVSTAQLLKFTDDVAVALRVTGTSAEGAQGALLQLGQLLGSGTVHAEEFNSVLEGVPTIAQAAARGIKEANGSVAALKKLVVDGKVSSKAFFDGFEAGAVTLQDQVASSESTISGGFIRLANVLVDVAKRFNENTHAADLMVTFLDDLGDAARTLAENLSDPRLGAFGDFLNDLNALAEGLGRKIGALTGLDQVAPAINGMLNGVKVEPVEAKLTELQKTVTALQDAIKFNTEMGIDTSTVQRQLDEVLAKIAAIKSGAAAVVTPLADQSEKGVANAINQMVPFNPLPPISTPAKTKQITLADYPLTGGGKGGGSHAIKKTADDAFQEDLQSIRDRAAALKEEFNALGLTYQEQQRRKVALDLEQQALKDVREAARKKGDADWQNIQLSAQQRAAIDEVAQAYAREADELRRAQELMDLQRDVLKGAFGDLRSALDDGKLDWQDLGNIALNALDKIIDKIENDLISAILDANSAAGGGGILGGLFGLLGLGGGSSSGGGMPWLEDIFRASGGPVAAGKPYIVGEKRAELFVPKQSGYILPSVPSMEDVRVVAPRMPDLQRRSREMMQANVTFAPTIHIQSSDGDAGQQVTAALKKFEREFTPRVMKSLREIKITTNGRI